MQLEVNHEAHGQPFCAPQRAGDSDGRAKLVNARILLGDALERYAESRRPAIVQLPLPGLVDGSRQSAQLRYARNGCKVDDSSINLPGMLSRTFVTHRTSRAIHPRTSEKLV
jgi:hypothetical protein